MNLDAVKTGKEVFSLNGNHVNHTILDFWKWSVSALMDNPTRGRLAEFIVGTAIGLKPEVYL